MAKSINQIQNELINDGTIDAIAQGLASRDEAGLDSLDLIPRAIIQFAAAFIDKARENINKSGSVDTGKLADGLTQGELRRSKASYELEVGYRSSDAAAKYYDFVNKGVRGTDSGQPSDSPYSYKTRTPSMNGPMVVAIQKWVKRNALAARRDTSKSTVTALQTKRKAVSELNTGRTTAFLIARKIKRKGLKRTGFFDNAVDEYFGDLFYQTMAEIAGADVRAVIRAGDLLINKENK
jgi:hypothetical protein